MDDDKHPHTAGPPDHSDTSRIAVRERANPSPNSNPNTSKPARDSSASSISTKRFQPKRTSSAVNSPNPSRESSPSRPNLRSNQPARPGRSRKNSFQDVSPSRSAGTNPNPPSAAATQRALSTASIPTLHPSTSEPPLRSPVPLKPSLASEVREVPHWPISPRLRSPPPVQRPSILSPRRPDHQVPSINVQRSAHPAESQEGKQGTDSETEDSLSASGMRTPARGASGASSTLETVQEISQPNTPHMGFDGALEMAENSASRSILERDSSDTASIRTLKAKPSLPANESGSESGERSEAKSRSSSIAPPPARQAGPATKSFSTGNGRGKPSGEGSTKNMTVETETVVSIPQVAVGTGGLGNNGSIRTKASIETIRPKKEKKKNARKAPSVNSGTGEQANSSKRRYHPHHHHHHNTREDPTEANAFDFTHEANGQGPYSASMSSEATSPERTSGFTFRRQSKNRQTMSTVLTRLRPASSKADIFEAKVASAVDEANSSDSEETFVYESNPPDANDRPRRFHSRTPSATSMASQVEQRNGVRSMLEGSKSVAMKKSMKFANTYNTTSQDSRTDDDDGKGGTVRSAMGTGRGTTHHHHIGRWGRNGGNGHPSLFDNESPFPHVARSKAPGNSSRSPPAESPRTMNMRMAGKKSPISAAYDFDDTADDERTPLISTVRSSRSGRSRRPNNSLRQLEHQGYRQDKSCLSRNAGCLVLFIMFILVAVGGVGFFFATTVALSEVKILALKNVLASEQDVLLDMKVQATNGNLVTVSVETCDLIVFAKSKYAGTDSEWWAHPGGELRTRRRRWFSRKDDDATDSPLGDDPDTNPNLEIGHIYTLSNALVFEASPFKHVHTTASGQIRVAHPGNETTPAGSERWGRVLQHEFDLIVRGTLTYTLPLSQTLRSSMVEGRVTVKPNAADQDPDTVHIIEGSSVINLI